MGTQWVTNQRLVILIWSEVAGHSPPDFIKKGGNKLHREREMVSALFCQFGDLRQFTPFEPIKSPDCPVYPKKRDRTGNDTTWSFG